MLPPSSPTLSEHESGCEPTADEDLIEQGKRELQQLGLADASKVESGYVVRMPKAYPVYDEH